MNADITARILGCIQDSDIDTVLTSLAVVARHIADDIVVENTDQQRPGWLARHLRWRNFAIEVDTLHRLFADLK